MIWGVKKLPNMEKRLNFFFFNTNEDAKWNKKWGGRSFVITFGDLGGSKSYPT